MNTKIVKTYKNGALVGSKTFTETSKVKHENVIDQALASSTALRELAQAQENLASEARKLRKKLILAESNVLARTKERDALKRALISKTDKIRSLEERNEDLVARLHAAKGDSDFLEEELERLNRVLLQLQKQSSTKQPSQIVPKQSTQAALRTDEISREDENPKEVLSSKEEAEELLAENDSKRAIAAKPVKSNWR